MSAADAMRKMIDMGIPVEQAIEIVAAFEITPADARKERNRRYYETHKKPKASETVLIQTVSQPPSERLKTSEKRLNSDAPRASDRDFLPSSNLTSNSDLFGKSSEVETNTTTSKASVLSPRGRAAFDEFWSLYPNKVGKPTALAAFERASRRVHWPEMLEGLHAYIAKADDRPWCNPATWLNQDRWADRPAPRGGPPRKLSRAEQLQEDLRQEILDEQHDQKTAGRPDLEADERFPRLAYERHGGRH